MNLPYMNEVLLCLVLSWVLGLVDVAGWGVGLRGENPTKKVA